MRFGYLMQAPCLIDDVHGGIEFNCTIQCLSPCYVNKETPEHQKAIKYSKKRCQSTKEERMMGLLMVAIDNVWHQ